MSLWTRGLNRMMKATGTRCEAQLSDGEAYEFYGIFDKENVLETTDGLSVVVAGSVLVVLADIAKKFVRHTVITLYHSPDPDQSQTWYVREVLYTGDGETARVSIVQNPADIEC